MPDRSSSSSRFQFDDSFDSSDDVDSGFDILATDSDDHVSDRGLGDKNNEDDNLFTPNLFQSIDGEEPPGGLYEEIVGHSDSDDRGERYTNPSIPGNLLFFNSSYFIEQNLRNSSQISCYLDVPTATVYSRPAYGKHSAAVTGVGGSSTRRPRRGRSRQPRRHRYFNKHNRLAPEHQPHQQHSPPPPPQPHRLQQHHPLQEEDYSLEFDQEDGQELRGKMQRNTRYF